MIRNMQDGSGQAPQLKAYLNLGNLNELPVWSKAPRGSEREVLTAIREAGYVGVQGENPALAQELGLETAASGRINLPGELEPLVETWKAQGNVCATLHVGWGMEDDATIDTLLEEILSLSAQYDLPLYIETHRATITQDLWRTVQWVKRYPDVRINGDFSHWYTGLEMTYGDIDEKFEFCRPVFERVRFMHGRIGSSGCMQVDLGDGTEGVHMTHFRQMWQMCFEGFLASAQPGDFIALAPELLPSSINYARSFPNAEGQLEEESDRWEQAQVINRVARECWNAAGGL